MNIILKKFQIAFLHLSPVITKYCLISCDKLQILNTNFFLRFHTYDYARHFVSACTRILGLEGTPEGVEDQGRLTRVAAVCISLKVFQNPHLARSIVLLLFTLDKYSIAASDLLVGQKE